ncbi:hypothetical protein ACFPRL_12770 [Pseudoclavibacter helvolus]
MSTTRSAPGARSPCITRTGPHGPPAPTGKPRSACSASGLPPHLVSSALRASTQRARAR